jgi:hypothetical protein
MKSPTCINDAAQIHCTNLSFIPLKRAHLGLKSDRNEHGAHSDFSSNVGGDGHACELAKKHQRDAVFVAVSSCDQWGRSHSRNGNSDLYWDLDNNTIAKQEANSPKSSAVEQLASDIEVLVTSDAEYRSGRVSIAYRLGRCSTWAIKIKVNSGTARRIICHGLTGEFEIYDSSAPSDTSIPQWITHSANAP